MNRFLRFILVGAMISHSLGCASKSVSSNDESSDASSMQAGNSDDAFADDFESDTKSNTADSESSGDDLSLDDGGNSQASSNVGEDPFAESNQIDELKQGDSDAGNKSETTAAQQSDPVDADSQLSQEVPPPTDIAELSPEAPAKSEPEVLTSNIDSNSTVSLEEVKPQVASSALERAELTEITGIKFKANDNGGTLLVESKNPVEFKTRSNASNRQFIIEIENAILPAKLKRGLNTRDIRGSIGSIDAYQNKGSSTARIVIQLREGVNEPAVQQEGSTLVIVASGAESVPAPVAVQDGDSSLYSTVADPNEDLQNPNILSSYSLADYLAGNVKFYGKKISLEVSNMDVRDALKFITEESGMNMIVSDEVKGTISLKLRQVPWDQALVVLMKTKNLGYTRQGNVLRITTMDELFKEEDRAAKLIADKKKLEQLKVRMFPISYAKVDELEKKIKDFLSERGRAVGDVRTNALVVTDTDESIAKIAKLIESLDVQPPQVLIEGKVVEAKESFQRDMGISWGASGQSVKLGQSRRGPVNMTPSLNVNQGQVGTGSLGFNINVGSFDVFGTLSAALALREKEDVVKVLSSPRIMAMTGETSIITQTTEVPVRTVTTTNSGPVESYQFKPLTLKLEVTPQITADASVIMKIAISRQFKGAIVSATEGTFEVNSREANSRVLVKNGHTAVIGGIYSNESTDSETGVPGLRKMPFVGSLFETTIKTKDKSEMLIFLTPRILGRSDIGSKTSGQDL